MHHYPSCPPASPFISLIQTSGNPGGDFFVSPADPMFYLHHTQIDRLWTIWYLKLHLNTNPTNLEHSLISHRQAVDPTTRQYALSGTNTMLDDPPSANTTLDFKIDVGYAGGGSVAMQNVLSTTAGLFCYIYV
jgi:tyrosinase